MYNELIDIDKFFNFRKIQPLLDSFCKLTGVASAIIDLKGNILLRSNWQKLCVEFHRKNPETCSRCIESDIFLTTKLKEGEKYTLYTCCNGLTDAAASIVIQGEYVANFFIGQFLLEAPDINFFKKQAQEFGFDEKSYLESLSQIPIISKNKIELILKYLVDFAELIGDIGRQSYELEEKVLELRQAENRAVNEKEKLSVTLKSVGDGVITADLQGNVVFLNNVSEQLTGWCNKDASGKPLMAVFNIIEEESGNKQDNLVNKVFLSNQTVNIPHHTVLIAQNDAKYIIEGSVAPILDRENNIIGVVLVFRDVTQKRIVETEMLKIKKLESLGVFAGGIAHDFNNLLAAILGNIELVENLVDEKTQSYSLLEEAKKASIRAKGLTQQLLTFARGGEPIKETKFISNIIKDSTEFVLHGTSVLCLYDIPDDLWQVNIDSGQISQVFQNIIINAIQATPEGGEIKIFCENIYEIKNKGLHLPGGKYIKIVIADSGVGIPEKDIDKIFDPYFSTKNEGRGLGLTICHSIISKHDGHIFVKSVEGKGTVFTIYLPAIVTDECIIQSEIEICDVNNQATVMVVDDELMILNMVKEMITMFGHKVLLVENGYQAITMYTDYYKKNKTIDIIIMDLTIPGGMGGKEAAQEILKINPQAKIVVASGYANDTIMSNYKKYGFVASIAKPFLLNEMKNVINEILGKS